MGAWIETERALSKIMDDSVAPYVGAWIETIWQSATANTPMSHPMWVRGLKHGESTEQYPCGMSHPMWVRGLKLCDT